MAHDAPPSLALVVHPKLAHDKPLTLEAMRLEHLPRELLGLVAARLQTARDLCAFQQCSNPLRWAATDDLLWKRLSQRDFGTPREFVDACKLTWKEAYRLQRQVLYNLMSSNTSGFAGLGLSSRPMVLRVA